MPSLSFEYDYIGLSETSPSSMEITTDRFSSPSSSSPHDTNTDGKIKTLILNLKDTELRLGLLGSLSPERKPFISPSGGSLHISYQINNTCIFFFVFSAKQHGPKDGWYDRGSIIVVVVLVVVVSVVSNFKQSSQFNKLSDESNDISVQVVRDGRHQSISIFDVVAGDVVPLKIGDQIPADGLFLNGYSLKIDESSMTGESDHVEVNGSNPLLLSGTKVSDGFGSMLVTSVSMNTAWGEMMSSISRDLDEETPLQARLNTLTSYIGKIGLAVAVLVLVVMTVRYFTGNTKDESGRVEYNGSKTKVNDVLNSVVAIIEIVVCVWFKLQDITTGCSDVNSGLHKVLAW